MSAKTHQRMLILAASMLSSAYFTAFFNSALLAQAQVPTPAATQTPSMKGMEHGGMDHRGMDYEIDMSLGPADAEVDLRFIDAMILHHQGGVKMAQEALQKSKHSELQKMAESDITLYTKQIKEMQQWRKVWYPRAADVPIGWNAQMSHMVPITPKGQQSMMMAMNLGAADAKFDLRFLNAMIPHHEMEINMSQVALKKSKRPEIKKLAQSILTSHQAQIKQMKQWRLAWYKQ
jgi:uncharacterized protein (DUF305 family)